MSVAKGDPAVGAKAGLKMKVTQSDGVTLRWYNSYTVQQLHEFNADTKNYLEWRQKKGPDALSEDEDNDEDLAYFASLASNSSMKEQEVKEILKRNMEEKNLEKTKTPVEATKEKKVAIVTMTKSVQTDNAKARTQTREVQTIPTPPPPPPPPATTAAAMPEDDKDKIIIPSHTIQTLPKFDATKALAQEFIINVTGFFCKLCHKFYHSEQSAKVSHCQSSTHYDKFKSALESGKFNKKDESNSNSTASAAETTTPTKATTAAGADKKTTAANTKPENKTPGASSSSAVAGKPESSDTPKKVEKKPGEEKTTPSAAAKSNAQQQSDKKPADDKRNSTTTNISNKNTSSSSQKDSGVVNRIKLFLSVF